MNLSKTMMALVGLAVLAGIAIHQDDISETPEQDQAAVAGTIIYDPRDSLPDEAATSPIESSGQEHCDSELSDSGDAPQDNCDTSLSGDELSQNIQEDSNR